MKASLHKSLNAESFILNLEPENPAEATEAKSLAAALHRSHIIIFRGFTYMQPQVEFLIQPDGGLT